MNKLFVVLFVASVALISVSHSATLNIIEVYTKPVFNIAVLNNRKPVVAYYFNSQCKKQSCDWIGPQLERIVKNKSEKIYLAKIDLDRVPSFVEEHGIQSYPTVMVYKGGEVVDVVEGPKWGQLVGLVNRAAKL